MRITGDPSVAEDVVQESLVAVWQSAGRFRGERRVLTWLLSLVYHKALNAVRIQSPVALDEQVDRLAVTALNGVNLQIGAGMFGLLGPNGAGKTTLMRILAGIVNPSSGSARVAGHDLSTEKGKTAVKAMLGYLPQELGLYPDLTARQFVDYMAILKGMNDPASRQKSVSQVLDMVGLAQAADRKLKGFSGGMKRRVGIAQALVNEPRLLIVDEPTAGLDPEERIRFRNLLVDLASDRVVILSTHIVEDIGQTSSDLAVLARGQIVFRGAPTALMEAATR